MSLKKHFLSLGLVLAIACALILPAPGIWMKTHGFVPVFVIMIFLISGWQFNFRDANLNHKFGLTLGLAIFISLFLGPFTGMGAVELFGFKAMTGLGLIVMCCGPVTLSSATVITGVAGGNSIWALFITIAMNLISIFTIPLMLKLSLEKAEGVDISAGKLLIKLILLVLLPFICGIVARKLSKIKSHPLVGYIPSSCVILTVYAASAASRELFCKSSFSEMLLLILAAFTVHAALMLLAWGGGKLIRLEVPEMKALLFVSSQKTLPIAISVLAVLCDNPGAAIIPCILFHFTQLFTDSALASKLAWVTPKLD